MTKKHFTALADFIKDHLKDAPKCNHFDSEHLYLLAGFLETQNPRFNKERWLGYIKGENGPNGGEVK